MKPFFQSPARLALLAYVADEWKGTPFVPHARLKRIGADCVGLAAEIYRECGVFPTYDLGQYHLDGGQHNEGSLILGWVEQSPYFQLVDEAPRPGDLLCFRLGRSIHHVGITTTANRFLHARQGFTAAESRLEEPAWAKRLTTIYRPVEL